MNSPTNTVIGKSMINKRKGHSLTKGKVIATQLERRYLQTKQMEVKVVEPGVALVLVGSACVVGIFALVIHGKGWPS
jgi:hypothetical protein